MSSSALADFLAATRRWAAPIQRKKRGIWQREGKAFTHCRAERRVPEKFAMEQSAAVTVSTKMEQSCITIQVSEIDLWRVAQMLVANYGDTAEQEASAR